MQDNQSQTKTYSGTAKTLHWIMGFLVLLMLAGASQMPEGTGAEKVEATMGHTGFGLILAVVALAALVNRLRQPPPELPDTIAVWQRVLSTWTHRALYLLIGVQVIAGIGLSATAPYVVRSFGIIPLSDLAADDKERFGVFHEMHEIGAYGLFVLAAMHIGAALYHHFIAKDVVLRRMWPRAKLPE